MFFKGSRYEHVETLTRTDASGREIRYKAIRRIPDTEPRYGWAVAAGERLDIIAFEVYRQPDRFWRICDANRAMWPPALADRPGRVIGIPGAVD
jgi:hypothetical protein